MKPTRKNFFVKKTVCTKSLSEYDFVLYNNLFGKKWDANNFHPSERIIEDRNYYSCGTSIEIDEIIKVLQQMKKKGANYVAINDNCDHHGYEIEGIKIEKASVKEIENFLANKRANKEKEKKIRQLEQKIQEINKGIL